MLQLHFEIVEINIERRLIFNDKIDQLNLCYSIRNIQIK